jgi:hypothetical protein
LREKRNVCSGAFRTKENGEYETPVFAAGGATEPAALVAATDDHRIVVLGVCLLLPRFRINDFGFDRIKTLMSFAVTKRALIGQLDTSCLCGYLRPILSVLLFHRTTFPVRLFKEVFWLLLSLNLQYDDNFWVSIC